MASNLGKFDPEAIERILKLLISVSEHAELFYFLAVVTILALLFVFMKAILEFLKEQRTNKVIDRCNSLMGRIEVKLDQLVPNERD